MSKKIARFDEEKIQQLITNPRIIRNKLKVQSAVNNARKFIEVQKEFGSFDDYIWRFGKPIQNNWKSTDQVPTSSEISDQLSSNLKKRGFKFIGSTIIYAYMQAIGMVNDHIISCFRHKEIRNLA